MKKFDNKIIVISLIVCVIIIITTILLMIKNNKAYISSYRNNSITNNEEGKENPSIEAKIDSNNEELMRLISEYHDLEISQLKSKNTTFVILGTDERAEETPRSDIIMIVKFEPSNNKIITVSVPRDTRVEIPGLKTDKINHAFAYGGCDLSKRTLENLFDISIDYYIKMSFESFKSIIDIFGGVKVYAKNELKYEESIVIPKGESILNGNQALFYVRYRNDAEGDLGRIKRQQEVIESTFKTVKSYEVDEALPLLLEAYSKKLETNLLFSDILSYYKLINAIDLTEHNKYTLKTESTIIDGIWYEIYNEEDLLKIKEIIK